MSFQEVKNIVLYKRKQFLSPINQFLPPILNSSGVISDNIYCIIYLLITQVSPVSSKRKGWYTRKGTHTPFIFPLCDGDHWTRACGGQVSVDIYFLYYMGIQKSNWQLNRLKDQMLQPHLNFSYFSYFSFQRAPIC